MYVCVAVAVGVGVAMALLLLLLSLTLVVAWRQGLLARCLPPSRAPAAAQPKPPGCGSLQHTSTPASDQNTDGSSAHVTGGTPRSQDGAVYQNQVGPARAEGEPGYVNVTNKVPEQGRAMSVDRGDGYTEIMHMYL